MEFGHSECNRVNTVGQTANSSDSIQTAPIGTV